jgi:mannose-6-phosphate isomerase
MKILPIKLERVLIEKIWGGRNFESLNIKLNENKLYGESWEVSAHKNHINKVSDDMLGLVFSNDDKELIFYKENYLKLIKYNLQDLIEKYKEELLGESIYKNYGKKFPLLIKYLDINDKLSIQVHPDNKYALKNEKDFGKTECWYVIDASGDAELIIGLKKGITKEIFIEKIQNNDFSGMFNKVKVKKGDYIYIKPGVVHASLRGSVLICEIQQNSDVTYRIYDFDRLDKGKKRELHLEKAIDVVDFDYFFEEEINEIEKNMDEWEKIKYKKCEHFGLEKINVIKKYEETNENFCVLSFVKGNGKLFLSKNTFLDIKTGDTYLIPAKFSYTITGEMEVLKSFVE